MRAARVFIFKATSLPLSPLEVRESLWLVRPCAVRFWNFASNAKEFLFPKWKAGFQDQVDSYRPTFTIITLSIASNYAERRMGGTHGSRGENSVQSRRYRGSTPDARLNQWQS